MNIATLVPCRNCGTAHSGKYCSECGQKVYTEEDKSLKHLFEEAFHFITHFDNKVFRTVGLILIKPGFVSRDYSSGIRSRYYKPISLFIVCVMLYLLFPMLSGMNITLSSHLNNMRSLGMNFPTDWALHKLKTEHLTELQLFENFNHASEKASKLMLLLFIPLTALLFRLLFSNKKKFFYDHFILAAEFNTFYLLVVYFLIPTLSLLTARLFHLQVADNDTPYSVLLTVSVICFAVLFSFRRMYGAKWAESIVKLLLFIPGFVAVIFIYRLILFSVIMVVI